MGDWVIVESPGDRKPMQRRPSAASAASSNDGAGGRDGGQPPKSKSARKRERQRAKKKAAQQGSEPATPKDLGASVAAGGELMAPVTDGAANGPTTLAEKFDQCAMDTSSEPAFPAPEPCNSPPRAALPDAGAAAGDEASKRFSAPANLIASWMRGVSDTIGRGSTGMPSSGADQGTARPTSAKYLKRHGAEGPAPVHFLSQGMVTDEELLAEVAREPAQASAPDAALGGVPGDTRRHSDGSSGGIPALLGLFPQGNGATADGGRRDSKGSGTSADSPPMPSRPLPQTPSATPWKGNENGGAEDEASVPQLPGHNLLCDEYIPAAPLPELAQAEDHSVPAATCAPTAPCPAPPNGAPTAAEGTGALPPNAGTAIAKTSPGSRGSLEFVDDLCGGIPGLSLLVSVSDSVARVAQSAGSLPSSPSMSPPKVTPASPMKDSKAPVAGSTPQDARIAAVKGDDKENAAVRESPHGKLAFLDVVQANVGPVDPLSFFDTEWERDSILHGSRTLSELPNARLVGGAAGTGAVLTKTPSKASAPSKYQLVASVSKGLMELGPRPLQQDAVHVGAVRGTVPVVLVCDGHGYVNLMGNAPTETPLDLRNSLHIGGRQAAEIACQAIAQYLDKYAHEFSIHSADRFFHKAFCLAHQVVLNQIRLGALSPGEEGGLTRYVHATGAAPGSAMDAAYFKQPISKWAHLVPKASASAAVLSKHLCTLEIPAFDASTPPASPPPAETVRSGSVGAGHGGADGKGGVEGVYYKRANGAWEHLDFGTTATCSMVLNAGDADKPHRKLCVTAHVGDSDACLFRFASVNASSKAVLQKGHWLTKEHTLYSEEERRRPVPRGVLLHHLEGRDSIKWKVKVDVTMPDGKVKAVAYEPSRGIGHIMGQHHGISPCPSVSVCEVQPLDVIIIASDGLWNALGGRRKAGDGGDVPIQLSPGQPLFTRMREFFVQHREKEAQVMAAELLALAKRLGLQDNTAVAIVKIAAIGQPPPHAARP